MKYPKCQQNRHDCFGCNENGRCVVLNNTEFKTRKNKTYTCPFYKSVMQAGITAEQIIEGDFQDDTELGY